MKVIAAPFEHNIITSNPQELAKQQEQILAETAPQDSPPIDSMDAVEKNPPVPPPNQNLPDVNATSPQTPPPVLNKP